MHGMNVLPPLRQDIDIVPFRHEGRSLLLVRDSLGIAEAGLALSADLAPLLRFFDGMTSPRDFQLAIAGRSDGEMVSIDEVTALVEKLDHLGLLQTGRYHRDRAAAVTSFAEMKERPPALAGSAYPGDPVEAAAEIDRLRALGAPAEDGLNAPAPRALAAPHIDLAVGGPSYGRAYRCLASARPSVILLLGTGHSLESPYSLTEKAFVTPLGRVPSDVETVRLLREAGGGAVAPQDFAHRSEHSIEFQLLFLQRLFPMEKVPIVPLLCGPLDHFRTTPLEIPAIAAFIDALKGWLSEPPEGKLVVAGVDLSHVGPKFGDAEPAPALEEQFRAGDRKLLDALEAGDADRFFQAVAGNGNRFKVCGFSALWTLLAALPGVKGKVLDYEVWHESATESAVSFASVSFSS
jgi:AmmeMemoRadiSam system protein B